MLIVTRAEAILVFIGHVPHAEGNNVASEEKSHQGRDSCPGEEVKVAWGKSKKSYNAEVLNVGSDTSAPATHRGSSRSEEERFSFELVAAAPRMSVEV